MHLTTRTAFVMITTLLMASCTTIKPDAPSRLDPITPKEMPASTISVPISVPVSDLRPLVESELPTPLLWVTGEDIGNGLTLQARLVRSGAVGLSGSQGALNWTIPAAVEDGRVDYNYEKRIDIVLGSKSVSVRTHADFGGAFNLNGVTSISITPNWGLAASTSAGHQWTEKLYTHLDLKIGKVKVSISGLADKALGPALAKAGKKIDSELESSIDLRAIASEAVAELVEPILIHEDPSVWLTAEPVAAAMGPIRHDGANLVVEPALAVHLRATVGSKPSNIPQPTLPDLQGSVEGVEPGINIALPAKLPFEAARKVAKDRLVGRVYDVKDSVRLHVKSVDLYGNGGLLVVRLGFTAENVVGEWFDVRGHVYLTGRPVYDASNQEARVEDFDYDLKTRNLLARAADWLLHDSFVRSIQEGLVFPMSDRIAEATSMMNLALAEIEISEYAQIQANIDSIQPGPIQISPEALSVPLHFAGSAQLLISPRK